MTRRKLTQEETKWIITNFRCWNDMITSNFLNESKTAKKNKKKKRKQRKKKPKKQKKSSEGLVKIQFILKLVLN